MIESLKAVAHLGEVKKGINRPIYALCNDNNIYIVKFLDNKKTLINEFLGSMLAKILNLPSADLAFVELDKDFIRLSTTLKERKINPGIHLGIKRLENVCYFNQIETNKIMPNLDNKSVIFDITCLDNWLLNDDRNNWGNNFIEMVNFSKYYYKIIDFSDCLLGENWDERKLEAYKTYNLPMRNFYPFLELLSNRPRINESINKIENCDKNVIEQIIDLIPQEWGIKDHEREKLKDILLFRQKKLKRILLQGKAQ